MADNEVSKIMWVAIVVALAASIFVIAKPQITSNTNSVMDTVQNVVKDTKTSNNLLSNSSWQNGQGTWTAGFNNRFEILKGESDRPNSAILHAKPRTTGTQQVTQTQLEIPVKEGETYTVSYDYKELNHTMNTNVMVLRIFDFDTPSKAEGWDEATQTINGESWYARVNSKFEGISTSESLGAPADGFKDWTRLSYTFKAPSSGYLALIPYDSDTTGNHESFWRELKVEKGSVATPWES